MTQYLKRKQKQSGFTLVELLVVIAIIGILTAIGVPMYNGYQTSAKVSATKQNLDTMKTFIAGEITKCSAGLVANLDDPKGGTAIACPTGLTDSAAATYFIPLAKSTIKNPYNTADLTNQVVTSVPTKAGELAIMTGVATCSGGLALQTAIADPKPDAPTNIALYPLASSECITFQ